MSRRHQVGFTLVELLIAITVFSVLAAMAYGGLRSVLNSERNINSASQRLRSIQQVMLFAGRDLAQISGRGIRDEYGDFKPPLRSKLNTFAGIEFTRGGWSNPAGQKRSTLQRVGYTVEDRQLVRYSWPVMDRAPDTQPNRFALLDKVVAMNTRFMDDTHAWQEQWPLPGTDPAAPDTLPRAVELTIELEDIGMLRRVFIIDATMAPAQPAQPAQPGQPPAPDTSS